jgi:hypothetical protein
MLASPSLPAAQRRGTRLADATLRRSDGVAKPTWPNGPPARNGGDAGHFEHWLARQTTRIWAVTVVVALQGDPVRATQAGRIVMLGGFVVGLVIVATLAGTVGAYLLEDRRDRQPETA